MFTARIADRLLAACDRRLAILAAATVNTWLVLAATATAQSDPASFANVINIPPGPAPFEAGAATQVNLNAGGALPHGFTARFGSEVNINGGHVGVSFSANAGSVVNVRGGALGQDFDAEANSDVEFFGAEFQLNGAPYLASTITLSGSDVFSGTLADGSPFIVSPLSAEVFHGVHLTAETLLAYDTAPILVDGSHPATVNGLRAGQALTMAAGGAIGGTFAVVDATVEVNGGHLAEQLKVSGGTVTMTAGSIGRLHAFQRSQFTMTGGTLGEEGRAYVGSDIHIRGGAVGELFLAESGSRVRLSGGTIGNRLRLNGAELIIDGGTAGAQNRFLDGTRVTVAGGAIGSFEAYGAEILISGGAVGQYAVLNDNSVMELSAGALGRNADFRPGTRLIMTGGAIGMDVTGRSGSDIELVGGEFRLNGVPYVGSVASLTESFVFSGTLVDGTPFVFSDAVGDYLSRVTLTSATLPEIDSTPMVVSDDSLGAPTGLRDGQTLTVSSDGQLPDDFAAVGAAVIVEGGRIGNGFEVVDSDVVIRDGEIGLWFNVYGTSHVEMHGGEIGGGSSIGSGSLFDLKHGTVGAGFVVREGGVANVHGGSFGNNFGLNSSGELNLYGTEFSIDGVPLSGLIAGEPFEIVERNAILTGRFADGSLFSFDLNTRNGTRNRDFFSPEALLTVTLSVPEPATELLAILCPLVVMTARCRRRGQRHVSQGQPST